MKGIITNNSKILYHFIKVILIIYSYYGCKKGNKNIYSSNNSNALLFNIAAEINYNVITESFLNHNNHHFGLVRIVDNGMDGRIFSFQ